MASSSSDSKPPAGYWGNLDESQQEALNTFLTESKKIRMKYYPKGAPYLNEQVDPSPKNMKIIYEALRFLRARKFAVDQSMIMYANFLEWRVKYDVDNIASEEHKPAKYDLVAKLIPHYHIGYDKQSRPVIYEKLGKVDPYALMNLVNEDEYLRVHIAKYERLWAEMEKHSASTGKHVETFTIVLDLKGVKIDSRKTSGYLNVCSKNDADNFPERLGKLIVINTPLLFNVLWKLASPLIDEKTKNKIMIVYGDPYNELTSVISPHEIPIEYGGINPTSVPEFDLKQLTLKDLTGTDAELKTIEIGAGKKHSEKLTVGGNSTIYWYHRVIEGSDIQTNISFISNKSESVFNKRSPTDQGSYCTAPDESGEFVFEIDNSFSWFAAKTVNYSLASIAGNAIADLQSKGGDDTQSS